MKIEYSKIIHCPRDDKEIDVENECCFCDNYSDENTQFGYVVCTFKAGENDDNDE